MTDPDQTDADLTQPDEAVGHTDLDSAATEEQPEVVEPAQEQPVETQPEGDARSALASGGSYGGSGAGAAPINEGEPEGSSAGTREESRSQPR